MQLIRIRAANEVIQTTLAHTYRTLGTCEKFSSFSVFREHIWRDCAHSLDPWNAFGKPYMLAHQRVDRFYAVPFLRRPQNTVDNIDICEWAYHRCLKESTKFEKELEISKLHWINLLHSPWHSIWFSKRFLLVYFKSQNWQLNWLGFADFFGGGIFDFPSTATSVWSTSMWSLPLASYEWSMIV